MGVRHGYRSTALSARYSTAMARDSEFSTKRVQDALLTCLERRRDREAPSDDDHASEDDTEERLLHRSTSTGNFTSRRPTKRSRTPIVRSRSASRVPSSSSPASTPSIPASQPVQMPFRTPSSEPSLQRQALQQNLDHQARRVELELREKEADVKRMELENLKLELEIEALRRASQQ